MPPNTYQELSTQLSVAIEKKKREQLVSDVATSVLTALTPLITQIATLTEEIKKKSEEVVEINIDPEAIRGPKGNDGISIKGDKGDMGFAGKDGVSIIGSKGDRGERGEKGDKGDAYVLSKDDMTKIASLVIVPEKVIERMVIAQPIVKEVMREVVREIEPKAKNFISGGGIKLAKITAGEGIIVEGTPRNGYTISSVGGSSGVSVLTPLSGVVDGTNQTFEYETAPSILVADNGRYMRQTNDNGEVNWTGTTTITLAIAPNTDLIALG